MFRTRIAAATLAGLTLASTGVTAGAALPPPGPAGPGSSCPNPHGGDCLGDLEPGTYETTVFRPQITYTVDEGWTNAEDLPGNFWLFRQDDSQTGVLGGSYAGIYANVRAAAINCDEARQPGVGRTPAALVRWYRSVPGLIVSKARKVQVGGLRGVSIDLALEPGEEACRYGPFRGTPLIIGGGVSQLHHVLLKQLGVRLVILKWRRGNVTIEITNLRKQHTAAEFRSLVRPVIRSLDFGR